MKKHMVLICNDFARHNSGLQHKNIVMQRIIIIIKGIDFVNLKNTVLICNYN